MVCGFEGTQCDEGKVKGEGAAVVWVVFDEKSVVEQEQVVA